MSSAAPSNRPLSDSVDPRSVEGLFLVALSKSNAEERARFLAEVCGDDADRRRRVEALLRAYDDAGSFMEKSPLSGVAGTHAEGSLEHIATELFAPADKPGTLGKLGPYEVIDAIGRGGMGLVYRALDPKLNRVVAIKLLAPELSANPAARRRFLREAQAAAAVSHPHVVTIFAVDEAPSPKKAGMIPYLVMECIVGQSLQQKVDNTGPLRLAEILRIGKQAAEGLAAAHKQGLIHRDIKPANILLENGVERVKITDFGLARAVDDATITRTGEVTGTPQYMSPEQARGEAVDQRSDLFSLGCVLYALCTGRSPFRSSSLAEAIKRVCDDAPRPITEQNPDLPVWLSEIISRLLEKNPAHRIQTADEVADVLAGHLAQVQAAQVTPLPGGGPAIAPRPVAPTRARPAATEAPALEERDGHIGKVAAAAVIGLIVGLAPDGSALGSLEFADWVFAGVGLLTVVCIALAILHSLQQSTQDDSGALEPGATFAIFLSMVAGLVIGLSFPRDGAIDRWYLFSIAAVISIWFAALTALRRSWLGRYTSQQLAGVLLGSGLTALAIGLTILPQWEWGPFSHRGQGLLKLAAYWFGSGFIGSWLIHRRQKAVHCGADALSTLVGWTFMSCLQGPLVLLAGLVTSLRGGTVADHRAPQVTAPRGSWKPTTILAWMGVAILSVAILIPILFIVALAIPAYQAAQARNRQAPPPTDGRVTTSAPINGGNHSASSASMFGGDGGSSSASPANDGAGYVEFLADNLAVEFSTEDGFRSTVYGNSSRLKELPLPAGHYTVIVRDESAGWVADSERDLPQSAGMSMMGAMSASPPFSRSRLAEIDVAAGQTVSQRIDRDYSRLAASPPDFSQPRIHKFLWFAESPYTLSSDQARIVQALLEAFAKGSSRVEESALLDSVAPPAGADSSRPASVQAVFNDGQHPAWTKLVRFDEAAQTCELAPPPAAAANAVPTIVTSPSNNSVAGPAASSEKADEGEPGSGGSFLRPGATGRKGFLNVDLEDQGLLVAIRRKSAFTGKPGGEEEVFTEVGWTQLPVATGEYQVLIRDELFGWRRDDRMESVTVSGNGFTDLKVRRDLGRHIWRGEARARPPLTRDSPDAYMQTEPGLTKFRWNGVDYLVPHRAAHWLDYFLLQTANGEPEVALSEEEVQKVTALFAPDLTDSVGDGPLMWGALIVPGATAGTYRLAPMALATVSLEIRDEGLNVRVQSSEASMTSFRLLRGPGKFALELVPGPYQFQAFDNELGWSQSSPFSGGVDGCWGELATVELAAGDRRDLVMARELQSSADPRPATFGGFFTPEPGKYRYVYYRFDASILKDGRQILMYEPQAQVIARLVRATLDGRPDVPESDLLKDLPALPGNYYDALRAEGKEVPEGDSGVTLESLFRLYHEELWKKLIVPGDQPGTWRLAPKPEKTVDEAATPPPAEASPGNAQP